MVYKSIEAYMIIQIFLLANCIHILYRYMCVCVYVFIYL